MCRSQTVLCTDPRLLSFLKHQQAILASLEPSTMFTRPSKKTILAALPFIASAGAVPCVQFDADWSLYAFGGSEDVKLGGSGSWGCKFIRVSRDTVEIRNVWQ